MPAQLPIEVRFIKRFASRLHMAGVPAHQMEGMLGSIASRLGYRCDVYSLPTAIFLSLAPVTDGEEADPLPAQLIRLAPGSFNLAEMSELYELSERLADRSLSVHEAHAWLMAHPPRVRYPTWLQTVCGGLISGAFAILLNTSWLGALTAAVAGVAAGVFFISASRAARAGSMEALVAVLVTLLVYAAHHAVPGIDPSSVIMAGLIVLIPGLALTVAVTELSTDHLSSGSARLAGALVVLLKLALGVLIGTVIARWLGWDAAAAASVPVRPPAWAQWGALAVASVSFAVLFSVRKRDAHIAILAAIVSYLLSRAGVVLGGVEFGVLIAALAIALLSNLLGRVLHRPASLVRVPGIILLVPGALGYRAVAEVLLYGESNPQATALQVAVLVIALVGGLLIGNTIVPPRRHI